MKKIWLSLFAIGLLFTRILSSFLYSVKEDYESVYISNTTRLMISVSDIHSDQTLDTVFSELTQLADQNEMNIYRQITNTDAISEYNRDVYAYIANETQFIQTFYVKDDEKITSLDMTNVDFAFYQNDREIAIHPFSESIAEGVSGFYYFETSEENFSLVRQELDQLGFVYKEYTTLDMSSVLEYLEDQPITEPLIVGLLLFIITFLFISLYEIFMRFKEIAVYKMIGHSSRHIIMLFF